MAGGLKLRKKCKAGGALLLKAPVIIILQRINTIDMKFLSSYSLYYLPNNPASNFAFLFLSLKQNRWHNICISETVLPRFLNLHHFPFSVDALQKSFCSLTIVRFAASK